MIFILIFFKENELKTRSEALSRKMTLFLRFFTFPRKIILFGFFSEFEVLFGRFSNKRVFFLDFQIYIFSTSDKF